jgi:hypothetical protein
MSDLEKCVARERLIRRGIDAIREAHVAADAAYRACADRAAEIILKIADVVETTWRDEISHRVCSRSRCALLALGRTLACNMAGRVRR